MAVLSGFAIPIAGVPADHTYVISNDGFVWPCWGRSTGGRLITAGNGSSTQANCLSQSNSQAGLIYGVTGVCHQTANRILFPAGVLVSQARGYGLSVALYGTYGSDRLAWPARIVACMNATGGGGGVHANQDDENVRDQAYRQEVFALYAARRPGDSPTGIEGHAPAGAEIRAHLRRELALLAEWRLGRPGVAEALYGFQQIALGEKTQLDRALLARRMSGEEYAANVNDLAARLASNTANEVGTIEAERLYDHVPGLPALIVEPEIAAAVYDQPKSRM